MKARDLLQDVLIDTGAIGARETMSAAQAQVGLRSLNRMMDGWQAKRLMVYAVTEVVATISTASATIGPGMQFNCPTPSAIERGSYFLQGSLTTPLDVWTLEAYNNLTLKGMSGLTDGVYLDRAAGVVRFWPVPSAAEFHLQVLARLPKFADLDTVYTLPDGYEEALFQSLRERLPSTFNLPMPADAPRQAAAARRALKTRNADVPTLQIDVSGGRFNILTNGR